MKELFAGFYGLSPEQTSEIWNDKTSVFIFDTNVLLLLYKCEVETRDSFFELWEKIKTRVWVPYHVCLEYQRNRLSAIKSHTLELENFGQYIKNQITSSLAIEHFDNKHKNTITRYEKLCEQLNILSEKIINISDEFIEEQIKTRIDAADFLNKHDTVRDRISDLLSSQIGAAPDQKRINELEEKGKKRYELLIPPGFEDAKTKNDSFHYNGVTYKSMYGDWFIWSELLELVAQKACKGVIFISNDVKDDWFFKTGGKTRGPLEHLKTELKSSGNGTELLLYTSSSFLHNANNFLSGNKVSEEAIKEIEHINTPPQDKIKATEIYNDPFPLHQDALAVMEDLKTVEELLSNTSRDMQTYYDLSRKREAIRSKLIEFAEQRRKWYHAREFEQQMIR
ncbi:PIN-like domain-containing protein [Klebsiella michiganensis]|uniref:PIN-like domain-containing protein n=1 Tax=Klebsiella michiganensis TaxID=1134687 RepID=UPI0038FA2307